MRSLLYALTVPCLISGCFFTQPSDGELGNVELAYDEGILGCLFGCDASEPMASDANTFLLVVNADELSGEFAPFVVSSSDDSVLEAIQNDGAGDASIRLASHAPGNARVVFEEEGGGELIDRFQINVHEIARIELGSPEVEQNVLVFVGGTATIYLSLFDAQNARLKGFGGVEYTLFGGLGATEVTLTSAIAEAIVQLFAGSTSESVRIEADELGAGGIRAEAVRGGATLDIPVEIVDESRVASVTVSESTAQPGSSLSLSAAAFAANGDPILDPVCTWSIAGGAATITFESRGSVTIDSDIETTAQVTCTIGAASGSGTATFEYPPD